MSIGELYEIQVNEGALSTPIEFKGGQELLEMYKELENKLGFEYVNKLCNLIVEQSNKIGEAAYKQGFKDATELFKA